LRIWKFCSIFAAFFEKIMEERPEIKKESMQDTQKDIRKEDKPEAQKDVKKDIRKEKKPANPRAAMYRRWAYMVVAIVASALMGLKPVFNFQEDRGIIYVRSFTIEENVFIVTQTDMKTNYTAETARISIAWLYYIRVAMLVGSILCFLCFFKNSWRLKLCSFTIACAGVYYLFMIYYALRMVDEQYVTLWPSFITLFPAVVVEMMVLTRQNIINASLDKADRAREE